MSDEVARANGEREEEKVAHEDGLSDDESLANMMDELDVDSELSASQSVLELCEAVEAMDADAESAYVDAVMPFAPHGINEAQVSGSIPVLPVAQVEYVKNQKVEYHSSTGKWMSAVV